jgi:hypothetical protein
MRANEFLIERATDVLFHYTGIRAGLKILQSGNFELASVTGTKSEEQYAPPGYPYFTNNNWRLSSLGGIRRCDVQTQW